MFAFASSIYVGHPGGGASSRPIRPAPGEAVVRRRSAPRGLRPPDRSLRLLALRGDAPAIGAELANPALRVGVEGDQLSPAPLVAGRANGARAADGPPPVRRRR